MEFWFGQDITLPISSLIYNVGHGAGTPGDQGADPFGLGFDNAALLATGTFLPGSISVFSTQLGTTGNVFDSVGSSTSSFVASPTLSVVDNLTG